MAKKTVVLLEDDIDGSDATETLSFALDGNEYEIDLNEGHASELREALARFAGTKASQGGPDARAVRLWATENGIDVNTRGRIQADVAEKYEAAH